MMTARLAIEGLSKRFAAPVLKRTSLRIETGCVHGLVGENGAGKSTLINIVSGLLKADEGILQLNGKTYDPHGRKEALGLGIALASQELSLIENLSIAENILLTALPQKLLSLDRRNLLREANRMMTEVGLFHISSDTLLSQLSLAEKQLVELAKALSMDPARCQLLILDEPTSALTQPQADRLHAIIRQRAAAGLSVIYVSHRLDDVLQVCDSISVLRDGEMQLTAPSSALTSKDLITAMSGEELFRNEDHGHSESGDVRLRVKNFSSADYPDPISLECHRGEILGLAGLTGSGRSELLHGIFGLVRKHQGEVTLIENGAEISIDSASKAVANGMALIAEDRKSQGIFSNKSVALNTTMAGLGKLGSSLAAALPKREQQISAEMIERLQIKCEGPLQVIDRLSGGNQQKVLFARWLQAEAEVWLLDEPTRGIDVNAKIAIHNQLKELRDNGGALIIASSELEELITLCDRILVLSNRKAIATFERGRWSKEKILAAAFSEHQTQRAV
ncbi:MAG: sugar ABC transporter ATP-binding protein [Gammaproteobacteria bacterium]|nr:sugar ABC transporter ATP-binding protein [Gammaproteobacteria bacterium]